MHGAGACRFPVYKVGILFVDASGIIARARTLASVCVLRPGPPTAQEIGTKAFANCVSLRTITLPEGLTTVGCAAFAGCTRLVTVDIPASLQAIGDGAFAGCPLLDVRTQQQATRISPRAIGVGQPESLAFML